ncbi:homologous recombination OB-fold protein [Tribolium castaneum]|uniref:Uncharacterized protein C17orf53-like Protein n=1 Tax=Tribolium castaneum TaxID=7070 RepID=D6WUG7_TRICA|nr:PREDICTED: uncharacterized protein C17orf53 [Tribolium castaneum]EFA08468.2 Uncharacterized protein C17orf53-like Protein [Tribolium castaneum]|eukprot:XP_008196148.1 PREDICTED: uncharacterized protein C17orf53 [Tribolium castaneum]
MFESDTDFDFGDDLGLNFDKINKHQSHSPPKRPKTVNAPVKRKFPGPAGLLDLENTKNEVIPCSQMSFSVFQAAPWLQMCRDHETLIDQFDINWIKGAATREELPNRKAPFLGAIIKSVECFEGKNTIVKVVLKDPTGEIQGSIIHNLFEEYSEFLVADSVIVLRQFSVITTSSGNHYLTITPNNLVAIYSSSGVKKLQEVSNEGPKKPTETKPKDEEIWAKALDGVDLDSLFDDF